MYKSERLAVRTIAARTALGRDKILEVCSGQPTCPYVGEAHAQRSAWTPIRCDEPTKGARACAVSRVQDAPTTASSARRCSAPASPCAVKVGSPSGRTYSPPRFCGRSTSRSSSRCPTSLNRSATPTKPFLMLFTDTASQFAAAEVVQASRAESRSKGRLLARHLAAVATASAHLRTRSGRQRRRPP